MGGLELGGQARGVGVTAGLDLAVEPLVALEEQVIAHAELLGGGEGDCALPSGSLPGDHLNDYF